LRPVLSRHPSSRRSFHRVCHKKDGSFFPPRPSEKCLTVPAMPWPRRGTAVSTSSPVPAFRSAATQSSRAHKSNVDGLWLGRSRTASR
jgi:hypothetical protein